MAAFSEYTALSFKGNEEDKRKIRIAAVSRGISVGDLVRKAILEYLADDAERTDVFFADTVPSMGQIVQDNGQQKESA